MRNLIAIITLTLASIAAHAEFFTVEDWHSKLEAKDMTSIGFFIGVVDTGDTLLHCAPAGSSVSAMISRVLSVSTQLTPEAQKAPAAKVITLILSKQYPCTHV